MDPDLDLAFKALADPTRRLLLDALFEQPGQTLGSLVGRVSMTRQAVSQHLAVLEAANLVASVKQGREKLHYLNPVPLHEVQRRWIHKFEDARLGALARVKNDAESRRRMSEQPDFVYVTYVEASPERVWQALTDPEVTAQYWGHRNVSTWQPGAGWEHRHGSDDGGRVEVLGTVVEADPPRLLVLTWSAPDRPHVHSTVRFDVEPFDGLVRLTVTHTDLVDDGERRGISLGWPAVLANLKTLLETGRPLSREPWTCTSST